MLQKQNFQKGFTPLNKLLKNTAKEYHLENAMYRHKALTAWAEAVSKFVEDAQNLTQAIDFNKGVLVVACLSQDVASKVKLMAERIMEQLNNLIGHRVVYAIYVEV
jgi:hypothetical protein